MKVKIKKEGKTKEFSLIKSWKDVTLSNCNNNRAF
jgi:hypothetical protein